MVCTHLAIMVTNELGSNSKVDWTGNKTRYPLQWRYGQNMLTLICTGWEIWHKTTCSGVKSPYSLTEFLTCVGVGVSSPPALVYGAFLIIKCSCSSSQSTVNRKRMPWTLFRASGPFSCYLQGHPHFFCLSWLRAQEWLPLQWSLY